MPAAGDVVPRARKPEPAPRPTTERGKAAPVDDGMAEIEETLRKRGDSVIVPTAILVNPATCCEDNA